MFQHFLSSRGWADNEADETLHFSLELMVDTYQLSGWLLLGGGGNGGSGGHTHYKLYGALVRGLLEDTAGVVSLLQNTT